MMHFLLTGHTDGASWRTEEVDVRSWEDLLATLNHFLEGTVGCFYPNTIASKAVDSLQQGQPFLYEEPWDGYTASFGFIIAQFRYMVAEA